MIAEEHQDFGDENADAPEAEFDQSMIDMLSEDFGPETFATLLGQCVEDIRVRLEKLEAFRSSGADSPACRSVAHQLKGLFLQFGANAAQRDAEALEIGDPGAANENLEALLKSAARALGFFEKLREEI